MASSSARKGKDFEREIVNAAKALDLEAERAYASNGESLGEHKETDCMIEGYRVQAKRAKKYLPQAIKDESREKFDVAVTRADREQAYAVIPYEEWLSMLKEIRHYKSEK